MQYYKNERMAIHNLRGVAGEDAAVQYLQHIGYHVQHRNWRTSFYEIDIIAVKENVIHFIEVKTRHSLKYGYPEEQVSRKKFLNLKKAAEFYLSLNPYWKRIQYDILSITRLYNKPDDFFLIEDVYI
jgi:putative endonuclease